jgi:carbamate kinase
MYLFHTILPVADNDASNRDAYRILQVEAIRTLLEQCPEILPIACGGGGIPVSRIPSNPQTLQGVEAVIDKDRCGGKLANELDADGYIILTDGGGIWQNFGKPDAREMKLATPEYLLGKKAGKNFPGSMGPKIQAAIDFVQNSRKEGAWAAIGDLRDASKMFTNEEGTLIKKDVKVAEGVVWRENKITASKMKLTKDQSKYG